MRAMEKSPKDADSQIDPMPENASVVDIPPKPSVWREFLKGFHDLFWQWYGLDKVAEDFNKHEESVRKGAALRFLLIIAVLMLGAGFGIKGCVDSSALDSARSDLSK